MTEKQKKLIEILRQMFQLDHSDLDFGIYRIMNAKAGEIKDFLENDLITSIKDAFASSANEALKRELAEAEAAARELGIAPETSPKVQELRSRLASTADSSELENEVYSHLTTFFSRYYKDGDFISLRRYKKDTYAIPYEGEEVKLYWANFDQYYIKTSEYFRDYTFKVSSGSGLIEGEEKKVHFKLVEADTETNNNKAAAGKERRFVLHEENPAEVKDGELYLYFEYKVVNKGSQKDLNKKAIETIFGLEGLDDWLPLLKTPAPTEKNKDRTLLEKHLDSYTARNTFDYFIHKDLGGFLNRELDFYIKNEMLYIDDIERAETAQIEASLKKIKTFKTIAKKIIAFLTQLEEFQKRLWLKKKFVIETNYCITLDKIDEKYYEEILANEAQLAEWKKLFDVTVETVEDLKNEPFLVLDTKFFDNDFKNRLLGEFDDLDEEIDGVLINSENFGALNLLQKRYDKQIKCTYIDPPYNTGKDGFLYKDGYRHSSWCTFISNLLYINKRLLTEDSILFISNDDKENHNLINLLKYNSYIFKTNMIWNTDGHTDNQFEIKINHEYITVAQSTKKAKYGNVVDPNTRQESNLWKNIAENSITKNGPANPFSKVILPVGFPVKNQKGTIAKNIPSKSFFEQLGSLNYYPRNLIKKFKLSFPIKYNSVKYENYRLIEPLEVSSGWANLNKLKKFINNNCIPFADGDGSLEFYLSKNGTIYYKKIKDSSRNIVSVLRNFTTTEKMKYKLEDMDIYFSYPKPVDLIEYILKIGDSKIYLDYFAGSGTTGHAVINLNRPNNGKRKYVLVEMGKYFDTVTKPRIQKVIYTDNWKDGKPQDKEGISQMFKYISLESYEDTLNNLDFKRSNEQQKVIDSNPALKEEYLLNYMLNFDTKESLLNIDAFTRPFDYKLKISTGSVGETKERTVDLVETFNYLIGLKVKTRRMIDGYLIIEGESLKEEKILVIWREGNDNDALNEFFTSLDIETDAIDLIYVNGDSTLESLKKEEDHFQVILIEETFKRQMFDAVQS